MPIAVAASGGYIANGAGIFEVGSPATLTATLTQADGVTPQVLTGRTFIQRVIDAAGVAGVAVTATLGAGGVITCALPANVLAPLMPEGGGALAATYNLVEIVTGGENLLLSRPLSVDAGGGVSGLVLDGVTDNAVELQALIDAGAPFTLPAGRIAFTPPLRMRLPASQGQVIRGQGPVASDGSGVGKTVLVPLAGGTDAIIIDGSGFGGYLENWGFEEFSLDMVNMAAGTNGFHQLQAFDGHHDNVTVMSDAGKTSWRFGPGAYTTSLRNPRGNGAYVLGDGVNNPTTITLINPDIKSLNCEQCANITLVGGAVQPVYEAGVTTVEYLAPGTQLLGYPPNTTGLYAAYGGYFLNVQYFTSIGTDWEQGGGFPATFNDGVHGVLPLLPSIRIHNSTDHFTFENCTAAGMYFYVIPGALGRVLGYQSGGGQGDFYFGPQTINYGGVNINEGTALRGYSDDRATQTFLLDASNGDALFKALTVGPNGPGDGSIALYDSHPGGARNVIAMSQNAASSTPGIINMNFGSAICFYTDDESTQTGQWRGDTGYMKIAPPGGGTLIFTGANGTVNASYGFFVGANNVVVARQTGWGGGSGGSRAAFNAGSATLAQTAAAVAALITDLTTHGLIGP